MIQYAETSHFASLFAKLITQHAFRASLSPETVYPYAEGFTTRHFWQHIQLHRWTGRVLIILGAIVGASALLMSYTMAIGGANETAATTLFGILFLLFLVMGFRSIRQHRIAEHRNWMIRVFASR